MLYDENDLAASMRKIELINFRQQLEVNGIKFECFNAGHVLGAAMFMIEIAGVKILYTGIAGRVRDGGGLLLGGWWDTSLWCV